MGAASGLHFACFLCARHRAAEQRSGMVVASDSTWGCRWSRFSFPLTRTLPSQLRLAEPCSDGVLSLPREGAAPRLLWCGLRGICDGSRIRDTVSGTRCSVREEEKRRGRARPVLEFRRDVVAPGHRPVGRHWDPWGLLGRTSRVSPPRPAAGTPVCGTMVDSRSPQPHIPHCFLGCETR